MEEGKLNVAWNRRQSIITPDTTCYRLLDAEGDGFPDLWAEWFDGRLLLQTQRHQPADVKPFIRALPGVRSIYWKRLDQRDKESPAWLWGEKVEEPFTVLENGGKYEISFTSGYSQGIFLDQRDNRLAIRERLAQTEPGSQRVLNLFAYTCAFSVAAAAGGGIATSVDLSPTYLDWGKRNMQLNGLEPAGHYFVKGDAFDWLQAFAKKGRKWQGVILDPPTFSRGQVKKVFRVEEDYAELVKLATQVLEPGGWMLCCANTRKVSSLEMEEQVRSGVAQARRRLSNFQSAPMPADFTGDAYLKSFWLDVA